MARKAKAPSRGSFRIIGGRWRGRRLSFLDDGSVRPTPDRIRETLFNWLANDIHEARCVDLFAGSGALGLEALSRGAGAVTFVDTQAKALAQIREHASLLGMEANMYRGTALSFLQSDTARFDIAFIDPPYGQDLVEPILQVLAPRLSAHNRVYVECESTLDLAPPPGWTPLKSKRAGQVGYHLLSCSPESGEIING